MNSALGSERNEPKLLSIVRHSMRNKEALALTVRGSWTRVRRRRCECHSFSGRPRRGARQRNACRVWPPVRTRSPSSLRSSTDSSRRHWRRHARCCCCSPPSAKQKRINRGSNERVFYGLIRDRLMISAPRTENVKKNVKKMRISHQNKQTANFVLNHLIRTKLHGVVFHTNLFRVHMFVFFIIAFLLVTSLIN